MAQHLSHSDRAALARTDVAAALSTMVTRTFGAGLKSANAYVLRLRGKRRLRRLLGADVRVVVIDDVHCRFFRGCRAAVDAGVPSDQVGFGSRVYSLVLGY